MFPDCESFDVLENEGSCLKLCHYTNEVERELVPGIIQNTVSDQREALTGRSAKYTIDCRIADPCSLPDALGTQRFHRVRDDSCVGKVVHVNGAVNRVDPDSGSDIEPSLLKSEAQPACSRKAVDPDWSHRCSLHIHSS